MTIATHDDAAALAETIAQRCQHATLRGESWKASCPAHEDARPSLSITPTADRVLLKCHAGCSTEAVVTALGMSMADLFIHSSAHRNGQRRIIKAYAYCDADGHLVHETLRYEPKDFRQRRPDPARPGEYIWNLEGIEPVLYRLPRVRAAVQRGEPIYLVEGEKDVETLEALGITATCNPMGAEKWRQSYTETLRDAHVVVIPDNDAPGHRHAQQVAQALHGHAASVKVIALPNLPEKGDASDWMSMGGTTAQLKAVVETTAIWSPPQSSSVNSLSSLPQWPQMAPEAFYGLAGEIVRTIAPHTESDPVAILVQLLVMVGNVINRAPYFPVEADKHHLNLFACLVGATSKGRKGTAAGYPKRLVTASDSAWGARVMGGLSSGEGVIWQVRDAVYGHDKKGAEVCLDEGAKDKRLCILETEFARALAKTGQEGNVLSAVLRQAWDHGDLRTLVSGRQKAPVTATHGHVSVIAHVTVDEVRRLLTDTEAANGFGNRFLWVCVRRSKLLPEGGMYPDRALTSPQEKLTLAIQHAQTVAGMQRSLKAQARWRDLYTLLAEGPSGLLGAITARAEAQVLRLSCLYALLDKTATVDVPHLDAAYALWRYCEDSARYIFGELLGDPLADELRRMLRQSAPEGMTRTDISNALGRHCSSTAIGQALARLQRDGCARATVQQTPGRSVETWYALTPTGNASGEKSEISEISPIAPDTTALNSLNSQCAHREASQDGDELVCLGCGEVLTGGRI